MPIPVICRCGRQFAVAEAYAGSEAACPQCGAVLAIPAAPAYVPPAPYGPGAPLYGDIDPAALAARFRRRALISVGTGIAGVVLSLVIVIVFATVDQGLEDESEPPMSVVAAALVLVFATAVLAIVSIIFGALGIGKANVQHRATAIIGLVLGIFSACLVGCCFGIMAIAAMAVALAEA